MKRPKPSPSQKPPDPARARRHRLHLLLARLEAERESWSRWLSRLKRAFHWVEKLHARINRLEREVRKLENA